MWGLVLVVAVLGSAHLAIEILKATPAEAQARRSYSECFAALLHEAPRANDQGVLPTPGRNHIVRIPRGWTVVSGAGNGILLCR